MKKYAKLICAVLVLALALGLGACGKPAEPKNAIWLKSSASSSRSRP